MESYGNTILKDLVSDKKGKQHLRRIKNQNVYKNTLCYEERDIIIPDPNDTFYINGKGTYYGFNILPFLFFHE